MAKRKAVAPAADVVAYADSTGQLHATEADAAAADAALADMAAEDTSPELTPDMVAALDTDTVRHILASCQEALADAATTPEARASAEALADVAGAELQSREAPERAALAAANAAAAAARREALASKPEPIQEAPASPDVDVCVQCKLPIVDVEMLDTLAGGFIHVACQEAYSAAIQEARRPARAAAPEARQEAPATLHGLPVPPARVGGEWSQQRINTARQSIWEARNGAETPDPEDGACYWCLQPYRAASKPMVGTDGRSYHPVCASFIGKHRTASAPRAASAASKQDVVAVQDTVAALAAQVAALMAQLEAATRNAAPASPVASQEARTA